MFRKLGLVCTALAVFSLAGGHWAALQTVAWAEMLRDYSHRHGSIASAVEQTFDGQHPCELCRKIAMAKSREQKGSADAPSLKEDARAKALVADASPCPARHPAAGITLPRDAWLRGLVRTEPPPTPPPRRLEFAA